MNALIVIRRKQLGRTPTRGKSYARPLSSGMEIINFTRHAGRDEAQPSSAICCRGFSRVRATGGLNIRFIRALQRIARSPELLFSGLPRFKFLQEPSSRVSQAFQKLTLSTQAMSLAAGVYGQHIGRREMKCPTKALKDPTK